MPSANSPGAQDRAALLRRIERELERIGLLLEHDAELPSFTAMVAQTPIRGSWWGHPLGHLIYDLIHDFSEGPGALWAKIVNGKVTYVHARLWPAFLMLAQDPSPERTRGLSPTARALLDRLAGVNTLRADELRDSGFAPPQAITKAMRELELRLLAHTDSVHTETGAHAKVLTSWSAWAAARNIAAPDMTLDAARASLSEAAAELCRNARKPPKLPW